MHSPQQRRRRTPGIGWHLNNVRAFKRPLHSRAVHCCSSSPPCSLLLPLLPAPPSSLSSPSLLSFATCLPLFLLLLLPLLLDYPSPPLFPPTGEAEISVNVNAVVSDKSFPGFPLFFRYCGPEKFGLAFHLQPLSSHLLFLFLSFLPSFLSFSRQGFSV